MICGQRPHAIHELGVQQSKARRSKHPPVASPLQQLVREQARSLEQITGAEQLGRDSIADPGLKRHQPVEHQQAGAAAGDIEPRIEIAFANAGSRTRAVASCRAATRARMSNSSASSSSDVEHVGEQRAAAQVAARGETGPPLGASGSSAPDAPVRL